MSTGVDLYMPMFVGDYLKDTADLTAEEHGAYLLLLMHLWNRGGELPSDPRRLMRLAAVYPDRWPEVWATISRFFHVHNGSISQGRLQRELTRAQENHAKASSMGKRAAEARWGAPPMAPQSPDDAVRNAHGNAVRNADAMPEDMPTQCPPPPPPPSEKKPPTTLPMPTTTRARASKAPPLALVQPGRSEDDVGVDEKHALGEAICRVRVLDPQQLSPGENRKTVELVQWCFENEVTEDDIAVWGEECWDVLRKRLGRRKVTAPTCSQLAETFAGKLVEEAAQRKESERFAAFVER